MVWEGGREGGREEYRNIVTVFHGWNEDAIFKKNLDVGQNDDEWLTWIDYDSLSLFLYDFTSFSLSLLLVVKI